MFQLLLTKKNNGFVALTIVLIFNAIGIIMAISLLLRGGIFLDNVSSFEQAARARSFASACSEDALISIKGNLVNGAKQIAFTDGKCSYDVSVSGNLVSIISTGFSKNYISKSSITAVIKNNSLMVISYKEDF